MSTPLREPTPFSAQCRAVQGLFLGPAHSSSLAVLSERMSKSRGRRPSACLSPGPGRGGGWTEVKESPLATFPGSHCSWTRRGSTGGLPTPDEEPAPGSSYSPATACVISPLWASVSLCVEWLWDCRETRALCQVWQETGLLCPRGRWVLRPRGVWIFRGPESGLTQAVCRGASGGGSGGSLKELPQPAPWHFQVQAAQPEEA